jgi:hypothetical protein
VAVNDQQLVVSANVGSRACPHEHAALHQRQLVRFVAEAVLQVVALVERFGLLVRVPGGCAANSFATRWGPLAAP